MSSPNMNPYEVVAIVILSPIFILCAALCFLVPVIIIFLPLIVCWLLHSFLGATSPNYVIVGVCCYLQLGVFILLPFLLEKRQ